MPADPQMQPRRHLRFYYAAWTRVISPAVDRVFHNTPNGLDGDWVDKLGLKGVPSQSFPRFNATGFANLGQSNERLQFPIRQYQIADNFTWIRGRHAFKFGGEARLGTNYDITRQLSGTFGFTPQGT